MFSAYETPKKVKDCNPDVWSVYCYDAILASEYKSSSKKCALAPWKLLNENIDKIYSGTIKSSFLNAMESVNYFSRKDSSYLVENGQNPFINFISKNPEYPITDGDYCRIKLLIGLLNAFFDIRSNAQDTSSPDHERCKVISEFNISDYQATVSGAVTSAAVHLSNMCDSVNSVLATINSKFEDAKVPSPNLGDRTVIFTNFAIYYSLFFYYKDAVKFVLDNVQSKDYSSFLDDNNYAVTILKTLDLKPYYLINREDPIKIKKIISKSNADNDFKKAVFEGSYDFQIIKGIFIIIIRNVVTSPYYNKDFSSKNFMEQYYYKFYSSFYNFCLKSDANFLNNLYYDPEFDIMQAAARDLKIVVLDISNSFLKILYNLVMGFFDSPNSSPFLSWISNTAEMCIALGEGFSFTRSESYSSLTLKSLIHNNAGLGLNMLMYSALETVIFNLNIAGFSLQEIYESVFILLDILGKYKDTNIVDFAKHYQKMSSAVDEDPYYKILLKTGAGIVCSNPLIFTVDKNNSEVGVVSFTYDYFNYAAFPTLPNIKGVARTYLEYIHSAVGSPDTIFATNKYLFGLMNYLKFSSSTDDLFLNASLLEESIDGISDYEMCLFDFAYKSKSSVIGSIIYGYPEKLAYDMLKFSERFSGIYPNFPLTDAQLYEVSTTKDAVGNLKVDALILSNNTKLNSLFIQFFTQYEPSTYYLVSSHVREVIIKETLEIYLELIPNILSAIKRYISSYQKSISLMAYIVQYLPTTLLLTYNSEWIINVLTTIKEWLESIHSSFDDKKIELHSLLSANTSLTTYPYTVNFSLSPKLVYLGRKMYSIVSLYSDLRDNIDYYLDDLKKIKADDFLSL